VIWVGQSCQLGSSHPFSLSLLRRVSGCISIRTPPFWYPYTWINYTQLKIHPHWPLANARRHFFILLSPRRGWPERARSQQMPLMGVTREISGSSWVTDWKKIALSVLMWSNAWIGVRMLEEGVGPRLLSILHVFIISFHFSFIAQRDFRDFRHRRREDLLRKTSLCARLLNNLAGPSVWRGRKWHLAPGACRPFNYICIVLWDGT
jgi:hypothetical protein